MLFAQGDTLVAVIELSLSSWLVAGVVPGVERQPLEKLESDETGLLRLLLHWRDEALRGTPFRVFVGAPALMDEQGSCWGWFGLVFGSGAV